jgi:putative isomerase
MRKKISIVRIACIAVAVFWNLAGAGAHYDSLKTVLMKGWNTWDVTSMLKQVLLPQGFAVNCVVAQDSHFCREARMGNATLLPGPHAYNGSYSDIEIEYFGPRLRIQTAWTNDTNFVELITPISGITANTFLQIECAMLWSKQGTITTESGAIKAVLPDKTVWVYSTKGPITKIPVAAGESIGISTGQNRTIAQITSIIDSGKTSFAGTFGAFKNDSDAYDAALANNAVTAWNVFYEPLGKRVIFSVSRDWSVGWGGYVMFCWDNFFGSYQISIFNKDLAMACAVEHVHNLTPGTNGYGRYIPNFACPNGWGGEPPLSPRSQPPVGSQMTWEIYRHYKEKWFLQEMYPNLLLWNRFWPQFRRTGGYLCWGGFPPTATWQGAAYESGLDNSPMFDNVPFTTYNNQMQLADVGLMGMYLMDCRILAKIANELGMTADKEELLYRASAFERQLSTLWDTAGVYKNRRTDNAAISDRISPTNLYPMLGWAPTQAQADKTVQNFLLNGNKLGGAWLLPSITRDDAAFNDQNYWRGRIWGPMNWLVYSGMWNYNMPAARATLAANSLKLLLQEWRNRHYVCENYSAIDGKWDGPGGHDRFYTWGALLSIIGLIDKGLVASPDSSRIKSDGHLAVNPFMRIEAEIYIEASSAIQIEVCSDNGGGMDVGHVTNTSFIKFDSLDFRQGASACSLRVAAAAGAGGTAELRLDSVNGALVGTATIPVTGGWQTYSTVICPITSCNGVHTLFIVFKTANPFTGNFNWFQFVPMTVSVASYIINKTVPAIIECRNGKISVSTKLSGDFRIDIISLDGRIAKSIVGSGAHDYLIDVAHLETRTRYAGGAYLVSVRQGKEKTYKRMMLWQ